MKIAFLIPAMRAGGAERMAAFLCSAWAEAGHDVSLLTYEGEGAASFFEADPRVTVKPLGLPGGAGDPVRALAANIRRVAALRRVLESSRPDILVCFMPEASIPGIIAARLARVPAVACERSDPRFIPVQRHLRLMRRAIYPLASAVTAQTRQAAAWLGGRVEVIGNPVRLPDMQPEARPFEGPFVAALGRYSAEKNFDVLIRAFAALAEAHPDIKLMIMGDGPERPALTRLAAEAGLSGRVLLEPARPDPFTILRHARLFVLPSRFEGFSNALCEAMACGLPVIAGKGVWGAEAVVEDGANGILCAIEDGALKDAMASLLGDPARAARLGLAARAVTEQWSSETVLKRWDALLRSISR